MKSAIVASVLLRSGSCLSSTDWAVKTSYLSVFRTGQNLLSVCLSHRTKPIICLSHRSKPVICLSFAPDKINHLSFAPVKTCYLSVFRTGQNQSSVFCTGQNLLSVFRTGQNLLSLYAPDKTCYLSVFRSGQNQLSVCLSYRTHSLSTSPHVVTEDCLFGLQFQPPPTATAVGQRPIQTIPSKWTRSPSQVKVWCFFLALIYAMPVCFHNVLCLYYVFPGPVNAILLQ